MATLYQIVAPHFTAGFCTDSNNTIWETAPKLKWLRDKPLYVAESYCKKKNWKLEQIEEGVVTFDKP